MLTLVGTSITSALFPPFHETPRALIFLSVAPQQMDPRAFRVAQQFVRAHLRQARYAPEFLQWAEGRRFPNPNPQGRLKDVKFDSLPDDHQKRIYEQWRGQKGVQEQPSSQEQVRQQAVDIARNGKIVARKPLSAGGKGQPGRNVSEIVRMRHGDQDQIFIRKPADGEKGYLRVGIPGGTYHAREQASYALDSLLGSQGALIPPTITRGNEDASYQAWSTGSKQMYDEDLNELVEKVPVKDLARSPSFHRLNLLDLIQGHEDRHRGNLLYAFDGEETPENLRFVAIDNGLTMSSPLLNPDMSVYVNPFQGYYVETENMDWGEQVQAQDKGKLEGDRVVAQSLSRIDPKLHEQLRQVDLADAAKGMTDAGVTDEAAVRATLVRIASLQADPTLFKTILDRNDGDLEKAWQEFQYLSGHKDDLLWRSGAGEEAEQRVNNALSRARPKGGWAEPPKIKEMTKIFAEMHGWGDADPGAATAPQGPKEQDDDLDFSMLASNVRDRWLIGKVMGRPRGRKLTVYRLTPGRRPKELGSFELRPNKKVKESYRDGRFRVDVSRGLQVMGRRFVPKDGPAFMAALEKVYGARSMYDVRRT